MATIEDTNHPTLKARLAAIEQTLVQIRSEVPFCMHTLDKDGVYLSVNAREILCLGYSRRDLVGKTKFQELLTIDSRKRYFKALKGLSSSVDIENNELVMVCKNGLSLPIMLNVKAINDDDGNFTHYLGVLFRYSNYLRTEEYQRIASIVFESIDGMIVTDSQGIILDVNRAFTTITGYSSEEVIGKSPSLLASGRHGNEFYQSMWMNLHQRGSWTGEIWNKRKNGEIYPERLTINAVYSSDGSVTNYVGVFGDITESKIAAHKIDHLAFYDPLTDLPNRRLLMDRLHHALDSSARTGREVAVLFIDLDDFKSINNTLGHDIGDNLLRQVAERLNRCIRKGDFVARLGGDEFVIILEDLHEQKIEATTQVESIAQKILDTLNETYILGEHQSHNSPSIGVSLFHYGEKTVEEALKQADIAMYQAKKAGRNTMRFFKPQMQTNINTRMAIQFDLRKAIETKQFQLHYQIQIDYKDHPFGAECLIRWLHPTRGLISPDQFIQLAEENGMILFIGHWVLETACKQLKKWESNPLTKDLVLSVNISARQLRQNDFVKQIRALTHQYQINPSLLMLEITESMLLEDIEDSIVKMVDLKKDGIRFSLDDFGTGYSCLQYLKRLPLEQFKIDQSFIRNIVTDASDRAIVSTIIGMANSLNLSVIAEGVETKMQHDLLLDIGCKNFQGYLFSKPVPINKFEKLLISGAGVDNP